MGQEGMLFLSSTGQGSFFLPAQQIASQQKGGHTVLVYSPNIKGCLLNLHTTIKDTIIFPFTKELQKKLCFTWKYNNSTRVSEIWLLLCLLTVSLPHNIVSGVLKDGRQPPYLRISNTAGQNLALPEHEDFRDVRCYRMQGRGRLNFFYFFFFFFLPFPSLLLPKLQAMSAKLLPSGINL